MTSSKDSGILDLEDQFAFYGQYHANKVNIAIHICCVPLIFWSALVLLNGLQLPSTTLATPLGNWILNPSTAIAAFYALYFSFLDPAGIPYGLLIMLACQSANTFSQSSGAYKTAGWIHAVAWMAQFIGHGKFEGRAPALLDNLFQSIVLAVFFVYMEVLFMFGYKPQLHTRLQNRIGKEILAYKQAKKRQGKPDDKAVDQQTVWRG